MSCSISLKNISKVFNTYNSGWSRVASWFFPIKPVKSYEVLKDISFSVSKGEAVAIVGQNGAGKSTLLKIISKTLSPTKGEIHLQGRVSAILELGMGFNPDFTGRQNVYNAAGLMGFTLPQIDSVIDKIEEFAEIGNYFDQPVRTYSSGMQMRVAFSVATAFRPDVLIVDEALSVGDAYFQHKSFEKIREFQREGTSLLLASHDKSAIQAICNSAILLNEGKIIKHSNPEEVMDFYNALIAKKEDSIIEQKRDKNGLTMTKSGTKEVEFTNITLLKDGGKKAEIFDVAQRVKLIIEVEILKDIDELVIGYLIKDRLGQDIFGTNSYYLKEAIRDAKKDSRYRYEFSLNLNLGVGSYTISVAAHSGYSHTSKNYRWIDKAIFFKVENFNKPQFIGSSWIKQDLRVTHEK